MNQNITEQDFTKLYDKYADKIYQHCFYRVPTTQIAEDLVQDTFMKTWNYISNGKVIDNIQAFLYQVARNLIIDYYRKKKESSLDKILEDNPQLEPSQSYENRLEDKLMADYVKNKLKELDQDIQEILVLRYIDDRSPKEIGEILNITANNASVRINRAVRQLQQYIKE